MRCIISRALIKRIAAHLGIVEQTVKVHRRQVMAKMEASSVAQVVRLCELADIEPEVVAWCARTSLHPPLHQGAIAARGHVVNDWR